MSERASLLVREEIELAKVEVTEKITKLIKGAVVGIAAGHLRRLRPPVSCCTAWPGWRGSSSSPTDQFFWGFFVVAAVLFLLGALAGFIASRALKSGAPPVPAMAIDEAKRIRETVQSPHPEQTV